MKKYVKLLLKCIGELQQACHNLPILVFISDAFVNAWYFNFNESGVVGGDHSF